jgi:tetratricopeptide (TPR) repeat protein
VSFVVYLRRALLASVVGAVAVAGANAVVASQNRAGPSVSSLDRLRAWLAATEQHQPGAYDAPLLAFASWPHRDLEGLFVDTAAFLEQIKTAEGRPARRIKSSFADGELPEVQRLAAAQAAKGINRFAHRAALFHTDLARFFPSADGGDAVSATDPGTAPRRSSAVLEDGTQRSVSAGGLHWDFAREILDAVEPDPAHDPWVLRWYQATASLFALDHQFSEAVPHFKRARQLFPADATILVHLGCFYEALAAPRIQDAMQAANLPGGVKFAVADERENLRLAADAFRQALAIDSGFTDAQMRLGRISGLLGNHEEALRLLRLARAGSRDAKASYYAAMLAGAEEQALGRMDEARQSFNSASALYPLAQSPHFALSQLAWLTGNSSDALQALASATKPDASRGPVDDPWWQYFDGMGGNAGALFRDLVSDFEQSER